MRVCSILALFISLALAGCTVVDDDDGDGTGDDTASDDGTGDGGDDTGGDDTGGDDTGGDDTGDDASGDGDDGDGAAVEPRSGVWDYRDYTPEQNDCGIPPDYGNGGGGFGLVNHGDGSFTVIPNDGTDPFDCDLDGADFFCPDRATEEAEIDPAYDATLVGQATAEGTFSDPENATGSQTVVLDCDGPDCPVIEALTGADFPCTFGVDIAIDWRAGS